MINGYTDRLKKWKATAVEQEDKGLAREISKQHQEQLAPFLFSMCDIAIVEPIECCYEGNDHSGTICTVSDDRHVTYNGETWSLSALAHSFLGWKRPPAGSCFFKNQGEWLNDLRRRNT